MAKNKDGNKKTRVQWVEKSTGIEINTDAILN
jgi:hypothetical protein